LKFSLLFAIVLVAAACGGSVEPTAQTDEPLDAAIIEMPADVTSTTVSITTIAPTTTYVVEEPDLGFVVPTEFAEGPAGDVERVAYESLRVFAEADMEGLAAILPPEVEAECGQALTGLGLPPEDFKLVGGLDIEIAEGQALASYSTEERGPGALLYVQIGEDWYLGVDCSWVESIASDTAEFDAKSDLRDALSVAKALYADSQSYDRLIEMAPIIEPALTFASLDDAGFGVIGAETDDQTVVLVTASASGRWFCIAESASTASVFGSGDSLGALSSMEGCAANEGW